MLKTLAAVLLMTLGAPGWTAVPFASRHVLVVDDVSGEVLLEKDSQVAAPIASLTKLMTAMVVLDALQDPDERVRIDEADRDTIKHTQHGVPIGAVVTRAELLALALMASDNHAAAALARAYPGGMAAFLDAVRAKCLTLGLTQTVIEEPTGLSANNLSSAVDWVLVLNAAAAYSEIERVTSHSHETVTISGRPRLVFNTNKLVGQAGWDILLSKTGFTDEAGRCISMRMLLAGRAVRLVMLGGHEPGSRALDVLNIRRWLAGEAPLASLPTAKLSAVKHGTRVDARRKASHR
jgi:D-alanyl-D-alanine carboxypeptidase/D-alanyl-D-alanine endopeptidase (penicillin-binding protein 7)